MKIISIINKNLKPEKVVFKERVVSGNFKIKGKSCYVKIFSELYDREHEESLGFVNKREGIQEAKHVARKYQDLVDAGFYPPSTQFIVARDEVDIITIISIMPEIDPLKGYPNLEKEKSILKTKAAKVLGVKENTLRSDTERDENYGLLGGKVYYFDLHVLGFHKILKNGKKYRFISIA